MDAGTAKACAAAGNVVRAMAIVCRRVCVFVSIRISGMATKPHKIHKTAFPERNGHKNAQNTQNSISGAGWPQKRTKHTKQHFLDMSILESTLESQDFSETANLLQNLH
jgi:hypothetical protein